MMNFVLTVALLAALVWIPLVNDRQFQGFPIGIVVVLALGALLIRPKRRED